MSKSVKIDHFKALIEGSFETLEKQTLQALTEITELK